MKDYKNMFRYMVLFSGMGMTLVIFILICMYVGIAIDRKLNTGYVFSALMTIIGMAVGSWRIYYLIIKNMMPDNEDNSEKKAIKDNKKPKGRDKPGG